MQTPHFLIFNTWLLFVLLLWALLHVLSPFLVPLTWAAVLATFFYPLHRRIRERLGKPNLAAILSTVCITVLLIVPASLVIPFVIGETYHMVKTMPTSEALDQVNVWLHKLPIAERSLDAAVQDFSIRAQTVLASFSAAAAGSVAHTAFNLGLTLFALYYSLRDGNKLVHGASKLTLIKPERWDHIVSEISQMVQVTVTTSFIVAGLQGVAGTVAFTALGISGPIVSGILMALTSLIPVVGALLVWFPVAAYFFLKGATVKGIVIAVTGVVVVLLIDNLVRPMLISGRSKLNPLLVLISVLGGLHAFGGLGLVLGPVVTAIAVALLHAFLTPGRPLLAPAEEPGDVPVS